MVAYGLKEEIIIGKLRQTITKNFVNSLSSFYLETPVDSCFTKRGVLQIRIKSLKCNKNENMNPQKIPAKEFVFSKKAGRKLQLNFITSIFQRFC